MKKYLPLFPFLLVLILLRLTNLSIRLSDTNIYFYTAYELLQGKILYKDIFFTNLPLFPYISTLYLFLSNNNIYFYYFTPTIEISCITILLYYIVYKKTADTILSLVSSLLYLFSFMVLSTSEHQTGVFLASLFSVIAYFYWDKKQYVFAGVFLAATILLKAYFLPVVLPFYLVSILQKKYKQTLVLFLGSLLVSILTLLPFILFTPTQIYNDIVGYSLTRSAGVSKGDIFYFFLIKDSLFFILLIFTIANVKRQLLFALISICSILFFIFYADSYYLYLNFLPPFLCLSLPEFISFLHKKYTLQKMVIPTFTGIFLIYTFVTYLTNYRNLGTYNDIQQLTNTIESTHASVLYGTNDVTPALAFLTHTTLLHNIIDTNTNIYRKGILHASLLTNDAIKQKAIIVTHGAYYPMYNINQPILDEIIDKNVVATHCQLVQSQPVYTEGISNRVNLFVCN